MSASASAASARRCLPAAGSGGAATMSATIARSPHMRQNECRNVTSSYAGAREMSPVRVR